MMNSTGMGATLSIFLPGMFLHNGFPREAPGLAVSASPRNLLEMQLWGHHPRPVNSGAMGVGPHMGCGPIWGAFTSPPGDAGARSNLEIIALI